MLRQIARTPRLYRAVANGYGYGPGSRKLGFPVRHFAVEENKPVTPEVVSEASKVEATQEKPPAAGNGASAEVAELQKKLSEKDDKITELNDKSLRVLAEMENVRAIARRDVANAKQYGIVGFAKNLLDVADNLSLALKSVPEESHSDALYTGVKATENELLKVFGQHGLTKYGKVGDEFDPQLHQAMYEAPTDKVAPGVILDVTKEGYSIGDRILRPAEVGVSKEAQ